jgi:hypothetical protein
MENSIIVDQVLEKLEFVNRQFYRLLLIVGPCERVRENVVKQVSEKINAPVININLAVSRQLLELPGKQRPLNTAKIIDSIIKSLTKNTFIFKNIELLFHAALETDPLRLFKNISRDKTLIAAWNGFIKDNYLIYAAPGHPDYKKYPTNDLNFIDLQDPG